MCRAPAGLGSVADRGQANENRVGRTLVNSDDGRVLLTVTSTAADATDLGYLLHKHPDRVQSQDLPVGRATVFYPEATSQRCTAALLLEVDPIDLVRGRPRTSSEAFALGQYVNDRPFAASSLLAVALGRVFTTALKGRCDARPELAAEPLPLELRVPALPARGAGDLSGAELVRALFEPLGWTVATREVELAEGLDGFDWGPAPYVDLTLSGELRLADALNHLYVLLPVLDGAKHYWVGPQEVDKLLRRGGGWLATHPERDLITRRYLAAQHSLMVEAGNRLDQLDDAPATDAGPDALPSCVTDAEGAAAPSKAHPGSAESSSAESGSAESSSPDPTADVSTADVPALGDATAADLGAADLAAADPTMSDPTAADTAADQLTGLRAGFVPLKVLRRDAVLAVLREIGALRVVDVGCGEGYYLEAMLTEGFSQILGVDVSARTLARAADRLHLGRRSERENERLTLRQSSLTYRDDALAGFDALLLVEVVEHVDPVRLPSLESNVFAHAAPRAAIVTTPNAEYNAVYGLAPGELRHPDHRFEWTRDEFGAWARDVADRYGYDVTFRPVGEVDDELGPPTQLALFRRSGHESPHDGSRRDSMDNSDSGGRRTAARSAAVS